MIIILIENFFINFSITVRIEKLKGILNYIPIIRTIRNFSKMNFFCLVLRCSFRSRLRFLLRGRFWTSFISWSYYGYCFLDWLFFWSWRRSIYCSRIATVLFPGLVLDVDVVFIVVELTNILDSGFALKDEDDAFAIVTTIFALR